MKTALELSGHLVDLAFSGFDGVARARAQPPDLVICDVGLPGMDGYQVARALRADPVLATIPLVGVSGYAQPEDLERSRTDANGCDRRYGVPRSSSRNVSEKVEAPGIEPPATGVENGRKRTKRDGNGRGSAGLIGKMRPFATAIRPDATALVYQGRCRHRTSYPARMVRDQGVRAGHVSAGCGPGWRPRSIAPPRRPRR